MVVSKRETEYNEVLAANRNHFPISMRLSCTLLYTLHRNLVHHFDAKLNETISNRKTYNDFLLAISVITNAKKIHLVVNNAKKCDGKI